MDDSSPIGLEKGVVRLLPYQDEWRRLFEQEKSALQAVLGGYILDLQHIGSTAIPGMSAKPIIDIAIAVNDFEEAKKCIPLVVGLGYEYRGEYGIPRRHYFVRGEPRLFHLHMMEVTSPNWHNLLLFRDYLIGHPESAGEYTALKKRLAEMYPTEREAYLEGKAELVQRILLLARGEGS
jgi:GrpB-like predicted nucleotidyltransferase (UPF0157 family)